VAVVLQPGKAFGSVLQELRRERGLSQEQLAEASGCHRAHVSFIERGLRSPSLDMVFQLACGLAISPSALIARVERKIGATVDPSSPADPPEGTDGPGLDGTR
jgi:transcriptional regulator with XRE-family HTH domain